MTVQPGSLTRQQLYDRIRESSKDEVILEEMIRLGFWPAGVDQPGLPDDLIRRRGEIQRRIAELHRKDARWRDPEAALKEMHKRRKRAAMDRRKETKLRNAQGRHERALAWHERRSNEIPYLGAEVSSGLSADEANVLKAGLPAIASPKALADLIGISLGELRFLAYDRALTKVSHYQRFTIPKKTGGERAISAPMPRLKRAQYWVLDTLLAHVPVHAAAHGFVPGRSIVTNATEHVGRDVVVNLDLKDFFPTLTFRRIKGKFRGLGYAEPVATVLALICTEPDVDELELDGERLYASKGPRRLPQGAPTSPALTNLVCLRLDARLSGLARAHGYAYTRYADDMTFSASGEAAAKVAPLLKQVREIIAAEGFVIHPDKTRIMRKGRRQEVTGLTVNERVAVPRETLRRFRALLHGIETSGPVGKSWGQARDVLDAAWGFACFVRMVSPEAGEALVTRVRPLRPQQPAGKTRSGFRAKAAQGGVPLPRWWHPAERPAPEPEPILVQPAKDAPEPRAAGRTVPSVGPTSREAPRTVFGARRGPGGRPEPVGETGRPPRMSFWLALIGVLVLFQAAVLIHPLLGFGVLTCAVAIGLRRWLNRRL